RQGRLGRHRPDPPRWVARLPDAGPAPRADREPAALGLPAGLERPLLRSLAAPAAPSADDPRAPAARERQAGLRGAALRGRAPARRARRDADNRDEAGGDFFGPAPRQGGS